MSYASEANKRYWKRIECEFLGIPVPDWAKLRRRGRRAKCANPEELVQCKKEYQHSYYLSHRGANVKRPFKDRTKLRRLTAEEREDRKRKQLAKLFAWRKNNPERYKEARNRSRRNRWATDSAWREKQLAYGRDYRRRRRKTDPEFAERARIRARKWWERVKADPVKYAEYLRNKREKYQRRKKSSNHDRSKQ